MTTGPQSSADPYYDAAKRAAIRWSRGSTRFVIRIDALGRFFQTEFTQILTDAATLSPTDWQAKCGEDYQPEVDPGDPPDPCGSPIVTLPGGKQVPVTLVVIPKQLWSDGPMVDWVNDRNDSLLLEVGQHGTYHANSVPNGDWATMSDRSFYSCDACGLTKAESLEYYRVGHETLLGTYDNAWVKQSGATSTAKEIDWSASANPLISFAAPYNTSDPNARWAIAQLGFKAFSASSFEEASAIFSPEGSHHEQFDQFGTFHGSADAQVDPPAIHSSDTYDDDAFDRELASHTHPGALNTWLIEEVEWSGRACEYQARLTNCNGVDNRENNTVFRPRWEAWVQLLDYVRDYPDSVAMTLGEVALAKAYDNAPTVANAGQADADHDGIGDVIDGAVLDAQDASLVRNQSGELRATLLDSGGNPLAGQRVEFSFDADGDGSAETYDATTSSSGVATVQVSPTLAVATGAPVRASWDGVRTTASDSASADVTDTARLTLDSANPNRGLIGDTVDVSAKLVDSDGSGIAGRTIEFSIGSDAGSAATGPNGLATSRITLTAPDGSRTLRATWSGGGGYSGDSDSSTFDVSKRGTKVVFDSDAPTSGDLTDNVTVGATLTDTLAGPLALRTLTFRLGSETRTATTDGSGHAQVTLPVQPPVGSQALSGSFAADGTYEAASDSRSFIVNRETTTLTLPDAVVTHKCRSARAVATLEDSDDGSLAGKTVRFYASTRGKWKLTWTATTDPLGMATWAIPASLIGTDRAKTPIRAIFSGDATYLSVQADAFAYRQ